MSRGKSDPESTPASATPAPPFALDPDDVRESPSPDTLDAARAAASVAVLPNLTFEQLKELFTIASSARETSPELQIAIKAIQQSGAATEALKEQVKRTVRLFNADHEHISVFNFDPECQHCLLGTRHPEGPEIDAGKIGHPKLKLTRETFFPKTARATTDECTILETKLFNQLGDHVSKMGRTEARKGLWSAWVTKDDKILFVDVPHYMGSQRDELPPLTQILTELLFGQQVADPNNMISAVLAMQKQIAELRAQLTASLAAHEPAAAASAAV